MEKDFYTAPGAAAPVVSEPGKDTQYTRSLSERLYGIEWEDHFPLPLQSGESSDRVEVASYDRAMEFVRQHHDRIFQQDLWNSPFRSAGDPEARERYYRESADCFLFIDGQSGDKPYGVYLGTPVDWSTYYLRYCAVFPEYQQGGRVQALLEHLLSVFRGAGLERVEVEISPSNLVNLHLFNKHKFNITGMQLSDRWGAVVRMTRFLSRDSESSFLDQFCYGIRPQLAAVASSQPGSS